MTDKYIFNALQDIKDDRDYIFSASASAIEDLPTKKDLRPYAGGIENQKNTGSCVANATVSALEILLQKAGAFFDLSRLFLYYNLREPYTNLKGQDKGSYLRDGFKSVSKLGICSERRWQFNPAVVNRRPSNESYAEALNHIVQRYERIPFYFNPNDVYKRPILNTKVALAKGFPVIFSAEIGSSFRILTGPLESHNYVGVTEDYRGHHAMCIVGYDDSLDGFIVENSWGSEWGDKGYCLIKYDIMLKMCSDAWVCTAFNNIVFEDEWNDLSPDITFKEKHITINNYQEDGRDFESKFDIISGTAPFKIEWNEYGVPAAGSFIIMEDELNIKYTLNPDKVEALVICKVTGSGPLKKYDVGYLKLIYNDVPNPNLPEPPKPPEPPEPPKHEPKKDKNAFLRFISKVVEFIKNLLS